MSRLLFQVFISSPLISFLLKLSRYQLIFSLKTVKFNLNCNLIKYALHLTYALFPGFKLRTSLISLLYYKPKL